MSEMNACTVHLHVQLDFSYLYGQGGRGVFKKKSGAFGRVFKDFLMAKLSNVGSRIERVEPDVVILTEARPHPVLCSTVHNCGDLWRRVDADVM